MNLFWDTALFNIVETDGRFAGCYYLHHQGDRPETSVNFNETTRRNIPEDSHFTFFVSPFVLF
jgi:hypothetical protein